MPSSLKSVAEFDALLAKARVELDQMVKLKPTDGAIDSLPRQCEMLTGMTQRHRLSTQVEGVA